MDGGVDTYLALGSRAVLWVVLQAVQWEGGGGAGKSANGCLRDGYFFAHSLIHKMLNTHHRGEWCRMSSEREI